MHAAASIGITRCLYACVGHITQHSTVLPQPAPIARPASLVEVLTVPRRPLPHAPAAADVARAGAPADSQVVLDLASVVVEAAVVLLLAFPVVLVATVARAIAGTAHVSWAGRGRQAKRCSRQTLCCRCVPASCFSTGQLMPRSGDGRSPAEAGAQAAAGPQCSEVKGARPESV